MIMLSCQLKGCRMHHPSKHQAKKQPRIRAFPSIHLHAPGCRLTELDSSRQHVIGKTKPIFNRLFWQKNFSSAGHVLNMVSYGGGPLEKPRHGKENFPKKILHGKIRVEKYPAYDPVQNSFCYFKCQVFCALNLAFQWHFARIL